MEKFRINDIGTLEMRLVQDRIQFSTTPDYQETIAELSKENAFKVFLKLYSWINNNKFIILTKDDLRRDKKNVNFKDIFVHDFKSSSIDMMKIRRAETIIFIDDDKIRTIKSRY